MEIAAALLQECEEISFTNVSGSLGAIVPSHHIPHPKLIQKLAINHLS